MTTNQILTALAIVGFMIVLVKLPSWIGKCLMIVLGLVIGFYPFISFVNGIIAQGAH